MSLLLLVAWGVGVGVLVARAPRAPGLAQIGLLLVAGLVLVNRSYEPQHALWLLPLAVLAVPRWRDLLVWQAGEVVYFVLVWWYLGDFLAPAGGGDAGFYWLAILLRVGCSAATWSVWSSRRPVTDGGRGGAERRLETIGRGDREGHRISTRRFGVFAGSVADGSLDHQ